jgi:hypothetical protein
MTRKATSKKPAARKPAKAKAAKPTKKSPKTAPAKKPPARSKRQKVYVVQQKTSGVYGDAQYTPPDRVFITQEAAQRYADDLNRELVALGGPFAYGNAGYLIEGGDKALTAIVERMGLRPPTARAGPTGRNLDWSGWWNDNYFNMTDDQREELCKALDKFEWFQVRTTTLE